MSSPVFDDIACFDSLPNDLMGVIMSKLDLFSALRLTQACPAARRLVQGERAVPGVLGKVFVNFRRDFNEPDLEVEVVNSGFWVSEVKPKSDDDAEAAAAEEHNAERQPSACIVHLLEWIRVRARAFTEIEIAFTTSIYRSILDHIASTFLPNVPSSFRGAIFFQFDMEVTELVHLPPFLAAWRALSPAYGCGLIFYLDEKPPKLDLLMAIVEAAPPLSSFEYHDGGFSKPGLRILQSLDTSRLTTLYAPGLSFTSLPYPPLLPSTLRRLTLDIAPRCWSSLDAFLVPLHRLTVLELSINSTDEESDPTLTLAPFTALPNLCLLDITTDVFVVLPSVGSEYWQSSIVLPALETLKLYLQHHNVPNAQGERGGPAARSPSRWPTLLSNLDAPKLERLEYCNVRTQATEADCDRTLDLPLRRFPRLRFFKVHVHAHLDLPALRAEVATLRERPPSNIIFMSKDRVPVSEEEAKAWKLDLGFQMRISAASSNPLGVHVQIF